MEVQDEPWVSVICTVYNHELYVREAIRSVQVQTYPKIELIIIDNGSQDDSLSQINAERSGTRGIVLIKNAENIGLCRAFNQGLKLARGKYIIDLSADDVLMPDRVAAQVKQFEQLPDNVAVVFSNAIHIDGRGRFLGYHYPVDTHGKACVQVPSGVVFKNVLEKYFICTPTMMMRRSVLDELGGYDEELCYEDFDFWVRSSACYSYFYLDEVLTCKRALSFSLGNKVYEKGSGMLQSTYRVCLKALRLCKTDEEKKALASRIRTFIRKCFYSGEFHLVADFKALLQSIENPGWKVSAFVLACRFRLPVNQLYRGYLNYFVKKKVKKISHNKIFYFSS